MKKQEKKYTFGLRKHGKQVVAVALTAASIGLAQGVSADEVVESGNQLSATTSANEGLNVASASTFTGETTAEVVVENVTPFNVVSSVTVNETVVGSVQEGDYKDYILTNIDGRSLNGKGLVSDSGQEIGTLTTEFYQVDQILPSDNASSIDTVGFETKVRATFNSVVSDLENISYSFGLKNVSSPVPVSSVDKASSVSVSTAEGVVASESYIQPVQIPEKNYQNTFVLSDANATEASGAVVLNSGIDVTVDSTEAFAAGDLIKIQTADNNVIFDVARISVGETKTFTRNRYPYEGTKVNDHSTYLYEDTKLVVRVVSVSDSELQLEVVENVQPEDSSYGLLFPSILVNTDGQEGSRVPYSRTVTVSSNGSSKQYEDDAIVNISGLNVSASGSLIKRSNVVVRNVLQGTDTDLVPEYVAYDKVVKGTSYKTSSAEELKDKYDLVTTPANAEGVTNGEDLTVIYEWKKKTGTVAWQAKTTTGDFLIPNGFLVRDADYGTAYGKDVPQTITTEDGLLYRWVSNTANPSGVVDKKEHQITSIYEAVKGSVTVEHVAEGGKVLKPKADVARDEVVGTKYATKTLTAEELANLAPETKVEDLKDRVITTTYKYELVSTPGNAKGEVVEGTTAVKYIYKLVATPNTVMKKGSVTVEHVAEDGTVLKPKADVARDEVVGTEYTTEALTEAELKELGPEPKVEEDDEKIVTTTYHYELVEVPANAEGEVAEGEINVTYVYKLVETVETVVKPKPVVSQPKSETPAPQKVEEVPVVKQAAVPTLPNTGDASAVVTTVAGGLSTIIGLLGFVKKED